MRILETHMALVSTHGDMMRNASMPSACSVPQLQFATAKHQGAVRESSTIDVQSFDILAQLGNWVLRLGIGKKLWLRSVKGFVKGSVKGSAKGSAQRFRL